MPSPAAAPRSPSSTSPRHPASASGDSFATGQSTTHEARPTTALPTLPPNPPCAAILGASPRAQARSSTTQARSPATSPTKPSWLSPLDPQLAGQSSSLCTQEALGLDLIMVRNTWGYNYTSPNLPLPRVVPQRHSPGLVHLLNSQCLALGKQEVFTQYLLSKQMPLIPKGNLKQASGQDL